jgi:hypothetical protein
MVDDHDEDNAEYDPIDSVPPETAPPVRSTAPQSAFTSRQVAVGFLLLLVGLAVTFGLPMLAA